MSPLWVLVHHVIGEFECSIKKMQDMDYSHHGQKKHTRREISERSHRRNGKIHFVRVAVIFLYWTAETLQIQLLQTQCSRLISSV